MKIVGLRSFSGPYFLAFGLNTDLHSVYLRIQFKCGKNSENGHFLRSETAQNSNENDIVSRHDILFNNLNTEICVATSYALLYSFRKWNVLTRQKSNNLHREID